MAPKQLTTEHKEAMAAGRAEGRAVKAYLDALAEHRPRRGRQRTADSIRQRLTVITGELGSATSLSMLAETRRLLDQQPAITWFRGYDRLDPALGNDRVHLLSQAGVRQQLDYVDKPAAGTSQPVLTLPGSVESPLNRDFRRAERERAVAVVEHQLDLRPLGRLAAWRTAEDYVLHRLTTNGHRRLLPERP